MQRAINSSLAPHFENKDYYQTAEVLRHFITSNGAVLQRNVTEIQSQTSVIDTKNVNRIIMIENIYTRHISDTIGVALYGDDCLCTEVNISLLDESQHGSDFHLSVGDTYILCSIINYCAIRVGEHGIYFSIEIQHIFWNFYDFSAAKYYGDFSYVDPPFNTTQQLIMKKIF